MRKVLMTPEGKRVIIDTKKDVCLFKAPVNPPNTGIKYTTGTDLYYHKSRNGNDYYYFYHWSMWQGSEDTLELVEKDKVEQFLLKKAGNIGWDSLSEESIKELEKYGFNLLEEDA